MGLHPRVLDHLELRIAARKLLDPRDHDLELNPELLKKLSSLRRPRCQRDPRSFRPGPAGRDGPVPQLMP
jgi:hypothetical protein